MGSKGDLAAANRRDAFMELMSRDSQMEMAVRKELYIAYRDGRWKNVHKELVVMTRDAVKEGDETYAETLEKALDDVWRYNDKEYVLGYCGYSPAQFPDSGSAKARVTEDPLDSDAHYFLYATDILYRTGKRGPKWCPEHSLAARQKAHRKKKRKRYWYQA